jgi:hypothetical protein
VRNLYNIEMDKLKTDGLQISDVGNPHWCVAAALARCGRRVKRWLKAGPALASQLLTSAAGITLASEIAAL